jgi:predicted ribosome quality control (RQC) complex YloA/Tae2 family protein
MSSSTPSFSDETKSSFWDEPDHEVHEDEDEQGIGGDGDDDDQEISGLLQEYQSWSAALDHAITSLKKKRASLESELQKAQGIEDTVARGQLLVSNLWLFTTTTPRVQSVTVQDWEHDGQEIELTLDPQYDSASAEADALFAQARKLKRGSRVISDLLETTAKAWELLQEARVDLDSSLVRLEETSDADMDEGRFGLVQDRLLRMSKTTNFQVPTLEDITKRSRRSSSSSNSFKRKPNIGSLASNVRKLMSPGGCIVLVGRNRRGNEHLSLNLARGNDIWMHSRGCPGAHVLVQNRRGGPKPTEDCLQFAADLAIFYSDLRNERKAPVSAAEPKHLQKPRGAPLGAIKVREEWKTFIGRPDSVPDELKEAREESGQSDEYRNIDKAKHRQRTKKVAQESAAKRRKTKQKKPRSESDDMY